MAVSILRNELRAGNAAAYRGFESCGVVARGVVPRQVEPRNRGAVHRTAQPDGAGERRALLGDHAMPARLAKLRKMCRQLSVHAPCQLVLFEFLMRTRRRYHHANQTVLSAKPAAIEHPLRIRCLDSTHAERQPRV